MMQAAFFNIEVNAGRYLAGDWCTTTISRKFGSGWEVGGYATGRAHMFGEGSFDKAIYVSSL